MLLETVFFFSNRMMRVKTIFKLFLGASLKR